MRVFLAIASKQGGKSISEIASAAAEAGIRTAFPVPAQTVTHEAWRSARSDVALLAWSNEPGQPSLLAPGRDRVTAVNGYLADPVDLRMLPTMDVGRTDLSQVGGCFAVFQAGESGVSAVTGATRACPVFHAETRHLHVIGTRALLVHLVARAAESGSTFAAPQWDVLALQSMIRQGYFVSDETPFRGVRAVPPGGGVHIENGRRTLLSPGLPTAEPVGARQRRTQVAELAAALIDSVAPLRSAGAPVRLALTGGRDSRLIAALLHAAKVPFQATTYGLEDSPDVAIARLVATRLGIEHQVVAPTQAEHEREIVVAHPLDRTLDVLRVCEGMSSAYESIVGYEPYSGKPTTSGQSGEILRGGFLCGMSSIAPPALERKVHDLFLNDAELFTQEANEHAAALADPWLTRVRANGPEVLDHMYLAFRVGRWHAGARAGALRRGTPVQPFLDNRVARLALALDPVWRRSEAVVHALIEGFTPGLTEIPLEGRAWRFLGESPDDSWSKVRRRIRRHMGNGSAPPAPPPRPAPPRKSWNWRAHGDLSRILLRGVARSEALSTIVDLDRVHAVFGDAAIGRPGLAWNLYTVAALLTEGLDPPVLPPQERLRIPIPD
ncbi:asparagine synthase C-terminal domain-containing protein [Rhizohabitans arisaemae]|uniref:asparagine synthase-related protein n=1 Tax=Rhizohabitans arisaemae TaxID=2720610 RepID=UPI0024B18037|nr:asparagine synthase C-terminal domain-containing protein [Rhizohabitans arisaemae]